VTPRKKKDDEAPEADRESPDPGARAPAEPRRKRRNPPTYADPVDDTLDDSFPASDPPSWAGQ
jgi:hypothetical protein